MENTFFSEVFLEFDGLTMKYGELIFQKTAALFLSLFGTFYALKLVLMLVQKSTSGKQFTVHDLVKPIIISSLVGLLLSSSHYIAEWVIYPLKNFSTGLTSITATLTSDLPADIDIPGMLNLVDAKLDAEIFTPCKDLQKSIGWKIYLNLAVFIVEILFVFVWFLFLAIIIEALFGFMVIFAISPALIVFYFFESTKSISIAGMKSLSHAIFTFFVVGMAMGFTLLAIGKLQNFAMKDAIDPDWLFSKSYYNVVVLSLISILFHLKAPKVAANLAQIDGGAGAAGVVAGIGTAAVMAGKGAVMSYAGAKYDKAMGGLKKYTDKWKEDRRNPMYDQIINR